MMVRPTNREFAFYLTLAFVCELYFDVRTLQIAAGTAYFGLFVIPEFIEMWRRPK